MFGAAPRELFQLAALDPGVNPYDVAADGQRFLVPAVPPPRDRHESGRRAISGRAARFGRIRWLNRWRSRVQIADSLEAAHEKGVHNVSRNVR